MSARSLGVSNEGVRWLIRCRHGPDKRDQMSNAKKGLFVESSVAITDMCTRAPRVTFVTACAERSVTARIGTGIGMAGHRQRHIRWHRPPLSFQATGGRSQRRLHAAAN